MLLLTTTSDIVRVVTTAAVETDVQVSWVDKNQSSGAISENRANTQITTATTTTVSGTVPATTTRNIKHLSVVAVGGAQTVTIEHFDGAVAVTVWKADLLVGESLVWTDGKGFKTYDAKGALKVSSLVTRFDSYFDLKALTNEPAVPAAGEARIYAKEIAGRIVPKWMGPSGMDFIVQPHVGTNRCRRIVPGSGTTVGVFPSNVATPAFTSEDMTISAGLVSTGGTFAQAAIASTNLKTQTKRTTMTTGATSGAGVYVKGDETEVWRGNAAQLGGFDFKARFGLTTLIATTRIFIGLRDVVSAPTNVDYQVAGTTAPGRMGVSLTGSTGNWQLNRTLTGTAPTVTDLGATMAVDTTSLWEFDMWCKPNDTTVYYRMVNWSTGAVVTGSFTTNLPAATTFLSPLAHINNNAASTTVMDLAGLYLESDY